MELWRLPSPWWHPDIGPEVSYDFATLVFLTASPGSLQSYTSAVDWNNANNVVEIIAGGGASGVRLGTANHCTGSGGGEYGKTTNFNFASPGTTTASWQAGIGGAAVVSSVNSAGNDGGDTWWDGATQLAATLGAIHGSKGPASANNVATTGGAGGTGGVGTTHNAGGRGGNFTGTGAGGGGSGGGGAGGATGVGGNGVDTASITNFTTTAGGAADTGGVGAGGGGAAGSGGAGGSDGTAGGNGTEWDASHGSGGGGGGAAGTAGGISGAGGSYGAGGGGYNPPTSSTATSSAGGQGIVVLTYTPLSSAWFDSFFNDPPPLKRVIIGY